MAPDLSPVVGEQRPHLDQAASSEHRADPAPLRAELESIGAEFEPSEFDRAEFATALEALPMATQVLFADYLKPLLVMESARRMLLIHGVHITPNGVETISDVGHMPISGQVRAELRADYQHKATHYRNRLELALRQAYPPTAITCGTPRRRRDRGGLQSSVL